MRRVEAMVARCGSGWGKGLKRYLGMAGRGSGENIGVCLTWTTTTKMKQQEQQQQEQQQLLLDQTKGMNNQQTKILHAASSWFTRKKRHLA
ncbi:hypothetical protein C0Q70_14730 [Pomacea canaliculata]|uniref:Uncharacterized protein n=1 Tax=Pomacea canaliculata TaxID=400727 RepID=A0A2T7NSU9_POMCA|nr:hypothetical protein C0Q70_14730 [Pomacea canaliculata]